MVDPRYTPVKMPSSGWRNNNTSKPTAWRRNGNKLEVRFDLRDSFKVTDVIGEIPNVRIDQANVQFFIDSSGNSFAMRLNNTDPVTLEYIGTGSSPTYPFIGVITADIDNDYDYTLWK